MGVFLHLAHNFVTLFKNIFEKYNICFIKTFFSKKNNPFHITWTHIFIFGPNLAVSCTFNRNITSLRKICTIWIYRNRAGTFLHFLQTLSKTLLVIVICNQKCMPSDLCGSDFYIWLAQTHFLEEKNLWIPKLYVICLKNVMVVILETHAKCHWLHKGL